MEKKKPIGVTVFGIILLLSSVPFLFALLLTGPRAGVFFIPLIAIPLICIITGVGLLKLKNWARMMTIFISPILSFIFFTVPSEFLHDKLPPAIAWSIVILEAGVISIGIIYYLTRPKVKEMFK